MVGINCDTCTAWLCYRRQAGESFGAAVGFFGGPSARLLPLALFRVGVSCPRFRTACDKLFVPGRYRGKFPSIETIGPFLDGFIPPTPNDTDQKPLTAF